MDTRTLNTIILFIQKAERLKSTLRSAHTATGRTESAAEHSWRLCLLVMMLAPFFEGADTEKLLKLAIVHDLAEAVCGDIPAVLQTAPGKADQERRCMAVLCADLPGDMRAGLAALWEEYEAGVTMEAKIVKALDKMETILQHNQGANPADFDYAFNLAYGKEYADAHPLLQRLRQEIDKGTMASIALKKALGAR